MSQQEMELIDAESDLEEAIEDMEQELKQKEKEVEKSAQMSPQEEDVSTSPSLPDKKEEVVSPQEENVEEDEEEEDRMIQLRPVLDLLLMRVQRRIKEMVLGVLLSLRLKSLGLGPWVSYWWSWLCKLVGQVSKNCICSVK